jgi:hypothetical protein
MVASAEKIHARQPCAHARGHRQAPLGNAATKPGYVKCAAREARKDFGGPAAARERVRHDDHRKPEALNYHQFISQGVASLTQQSATGSCEHRQPQVGTASLNCWYDLFSRGAAIGYATTRAGGGASTAQMLAGADIAYGGSRTAPRAGQMLEHYHLTTRPAGNKAWVGRSKSGEVHAPSSQGDDARKGAAGTGKCTNYAFKIDARRCWEESSNEGTRRQIRGRRLPARAGQRGAFTIDRRRSMRESTVSIGASQEDDRESNVHRDDFRLQLNRRSNRVEIGRGVPGDDVSGSTIATANCQTFSSGPRRIETTVQAPRYGNASRKQPKPGIRRADSSKYRPRWNCHMTGSRRSTKSSKRATAPRYHIYMFYASDGETTPGPVHAGVRCTLGRRGRELSVISCSGTGQPARHRNRLVIQVHARGRQPSGSLAVRHGMRYGISRRRGQPND